MGETAFAIAGVLFLLALAPALLRLGWRFGGPAWFLAWASHSLAGVAAQLSSTQPAFLPLIPTLGTAFATMLVVGAFRFSRPEAHLPSWVWPGFVGVVVARIAAQFFWGQDLSQILGAITIVLGVAASCWILLNPPGQRRPDVWERGLAYTFPAIGATAVFYAWNELSGSAIPSAQFIWLLVGIAFCVLQLSAFLARTTEKIRDLRAEATISKEAKDRVEAKYREVTENASDLIAEIDEEGVVLYANPAHEALLGYKVESIVGTRAETLLSGERSIESIRVDLSQAARSDTQQRRIPFRCRDGSVLEVECNFRAFTLESGERRFVVTGRDITARVASERIKEGARKELEALVDERTSALRSSLDELQRSRRLAALGTLSAGVAHQINNPVGSIQMSAEFALSSDELESAPFEWREALENCRDEAIRCGKIVSNMLQFARNQPTEKAEEDLALILRRVCDQSESYAHLQSATLDASGIKGPLPIFGSPLDLEEALLNIIRNAVESSDESVYISVETQRRGDQALAFIRDTGRGMNDSASERAFDPFYTTRLDEGGTGLGLSVAHGIVADHGGSLKVSSQVDRGTEVELSLPLFKESFSDRRVSRRPSHPSRTPPGP